MSLQVANIGKTFLGRGDPLEILRNCSFELHPKESLSIVGPSGSGKSTLLNIIGTLEKPDEGSISLNSIDVLNLPAGRLPEFRRHQIGFIFQDHHLLPQCNALENVLMPFLAEGKVSTEQKNRAVDLLKQVGLAERLNHFPSELSGGERQRVAIARSLVYEPSLLLADEPTGNLDRDAASQIGDLLFQISETKMILVVTHDPVLASRTKKQGRLEDKTLVFYN